MTLSTISIAGFRILLNSPDLGEFSLGPSFIPFLVPNDPGDHDIKISLVEKLTGTPDFSGDPVFESRDDERKYFSVFKKENVLGFLIYHPTKTNVIQQKALLKHDLSEWEICLNKDHSDITPLSYPMGPLILYYLTVKFEAVMMHASGIDDLGKGRLFAGFSGSGKSTMAQLWNQKGSNVINDDRIMIRKEHSGFFIYNTPMVYAEMPKKAPLRYIYLIEHSEKNHIERLEGVRAVSGVMAFCIQHGYNSPFLRHHLDFISDLCESVPVYRLGFVPEEKITDFINAYGS